MHGGYGNGGSDVGGGGAFVCGCGVGDGGALKARAFGVLSFTLTSWFVYQTKNFEPGTTKSS